MVDFKEKLLSHDFFRVLCVGDQQTSQDKTSPKWSDWLSRSLLENGDIQKTWRRQLVNVAIDRATPRHVATYYMHYIGQFKPDLVILSFGVTPLYPDFNEKVAEAEISGLLETFSKNETAVALWSPYPLLTGEKRSDTIALGAMYKRLAEEHSCVFVDIFHEFDGVELAKLFTLKIVDKSLAFGQKVGGMDAISLNEIGNYILAKKLATDIFGYALPAQDVGSYKTPVMENVKSWASPI